MSYMYGTRVALPPDVRPSLLGWLAVAALSVGLAGCTFDSSGLGRLAGEPALPGADAGTIQDDTMEPATGGGPTDPGDNASSRSCEEVCPASLGTCEAGVCVIKCERFDSCAAAVVCPLGVPCRTICSGRRSCAAGVQCAGPDGCEIECSGRNSCTGPLTCGAGSCDVACTGLSACDSRIDCSASCSCDIGCSLGACGQASAACPAGCAIPGADGERAGVDCLDTAACSQCEASP
jgi:hypothetical protein